VRRLARPTVAAGYNQELGVGDGKRSKNIGAPLGDSTSWYFDDLVLAPAVPPGQRFVDLQGFCKSLVAFVIRGVDSLPRRQNEDASIVPILREKGSQFMRLKPCRLIDHAKSVDDASIEEDQVKLGRLLILCDVSLQDLACELECWRARAHTASEALLDDGASALVDRLVAACAKGCKKRGLSSAGAASDNDSTHAGEQ
jgi:hypothetical protein